MNEKLPGRAAITLATTKTVYLEMAYTLARSFMVWNRDSGIDFHIITDLETELNGLMTYDRAVIKMNPERVRKVVMSLRLKG